MRHLPVALALVQGLVIGRFLAPLLFEPEGKPFNALMTTLGLYALVLNDSANIQYGGTRA